MSWNTKSDRPGASLCNPDFPSMDSSFVRDHVIYLEDKKWYQHYNENLMKSVSKSESRYTLPRPLMFFNLPVWSGFIIPDIFRHKEGRQIICNFNLQYVSCPVDKLRIPNDEEYNKYFRWHVENRTFVLSESTVNKKKVIKAIKRSYKMEMEAA